MWRLRLGAWIRVCVLCLLSGVTMTACSHEVTVSGKSAQDVFKNPKVLALVQAACHGDAARVKALAKQGVNVNATGYRETTPLAWTLLCHNHAGLKALLKAGANPNFKMEGDMSPMWLAAGGDDPGALRILLNHGGNPDIWASSDNALMTAIGQFRDANFHILLQHGANVNSHDSVRDSAAVYATALGQFDKVIVLLKHGYTYDLKGLARAVVIRSVPKNTKSSRNKQKVIEMLKQRGVKFPLPPIKPPPLPKRSLQSSNAPWRH